jgi:hypothetical protein
MGERLPRAEVLRRGILFRDLSWDHQRQRIGIGFEAFMLRPSDQGELSVYRAALETREQTFERLQRSEALAELEVGEVEEFGLRVEASSDPADPAHAVILGLPTPNRKDPHAPETAFAVEKARALAAISHVADHRTKPVDELVRRLIEAGQVVP